MDFRVVDIVTFAPNSVRALFRTGGNPDGVSNGTYSPPYLAVQTGTHEIRVFLDSTDLATASTVLFDTTVTFVENTNYTFYLYGSARTPPLKALITADSVPSIAAGNFAVRVLNLAPSLDGTPVAAPTSTTPVDAFVKVVSTVPPFSGSAATNVAYLGKSAYTQIATGSNYRAALTATGTTGPTLFQAKLPNGIAATSTVSASSGTTVDGSAFTILLVPRAPTGSVSRNSGSSGKLADSTIQFSGTTATARFTSSPGFAVNDIVNVTGASDAAFNGSFVVTATSSISADTTAVPPRTVAVYTVSYKLYSTPSAAATGARLRPVTTDYTTPAAFILIDH